MNLLQLAGALPRDPQFREWCAQWIANGVDEVDAAWHIREVCEVKSRRDLATNPEAAARFHSLIRKPFIEWKEQQEQMV